MSESSSKLNYIVVYDGSVYRVYERLGKDVPLSAYNPSKHLGLGTTFDEAIENADIPRWMIETRTYEVNL